MHVQLQRYFTSRSSWYKEVFNTKTGTLVLGDLCKLANMNRQSYTPNDPHRTAYNEGMKAVILHIERVMKQGELPAESLIKKYQSATQKEIQS